MIYPELQEAYRNAVEEGVAELKNNEVELRSLVEECGLTADALEEVLTSEEASYLSNYDPTPEIYLANQAMLELQCSPETRDHVQNFLAKILEKLDLTDSVNLVNAKLNGDESGSCAYAEDTFVEAYRQVAHSMFFFQNRLSVYRDSVGRALFFRKDQEVSSALSLTDINIGSAILPAGTIVYLDPNWAGSCKQEGKKTFPGINGDDDLDTAFTFEVYQSDKSPALVPLRLSPWALLSANRRSLFAFSVGKFTNKEWVDRVDFDLDRYATIGSVDINSFRHAAESLVFACLNATLQPSSKN